MSTSMGYAGAGSGAAVVGYGPRTVARHWIAGGDLGARQTLEHMRKLARAGITDAVILETAARIAGTAPVRDQHAQAGALRAWLLARVKFLQDPLGVELLRTPRYMLDRIAEGGVVRVDCDDAAILGASLALAIGIPARFVAVGFGPSPARLAHVFTEVLTRDGWQELDVTRPLTKPRPPFTRRVIREV